jgi:hypothetical protein
MNSYDKNRAEFEAAARGLQQETTSLFLWAWPGVGKGLLSDNSFVVVVTGGVGSKSQSEQSLELSDSAVGDIRLLHQIQGATSGPQTFWCYCQCLLRVGAVPAWPVDGFLEAAYSCRCLELLMSLLLPYSCWCLDWALQVSFSLVALALHKPSMCDSLCSVLVLACVSSSNAHFSAIGLQWKHLGTSHLLAFDAFDASCLKPLPASFSHVKPRASCAF